MLMSPVMAMAMQADITFDLGLAPSVLAALRSPQTVRRIVLAAAESYNDDVHNWIDDGHAFAVQERNGQIAQNINWRPIAEGGEVYVNSAMHIARDENGRDVPMQELTYYLEHGTGEFAGHREWVIGPREGRKGIKIPTSDGSGYVVRRSVIHKGSRAFPFFFADIQNRQNNMISAGRSVLAAEIAGAGNG